MDQSTARSLAREIGRRAQELGLPITLEDDPDCAELASACERSGVPLSSVLR